MVIECDQRINRKYNDDNNITKYDTIKIKNTTNQTSQDLKTIPKDIKIYVVGGFDPEKESRYSNEKHIRRNTYSAEELSKILEKFEDIEKEIDPNWSPLAKALFVYFMLKRKMKFAKYNLQMMYDYDYLSWESIDTEIRSLRGLASDTSVCAGFAQIYKEFMDRQGINCKYRARHSKHAWNEIEINGEYYPVDLTLEIAEKDKRVTLKYFMNNPKFYDMPEHKADDSEGPCVSRTLSDDEILKAHLEIVDTKHRRAQESGDLEI